LKVVDLFCGAGGFSQGFKEAGFEIVWALDNDFLACESYRLNHGNVVTQENIQNILSIPTCDVLIGSPPCPEFSVANRNFKRQPDLTFVTKFLDIVAANKPKYWVMENVPQLLNYIPEYKHKAQILQANWFGLHHKRERVFIGDFPRVKKKTDIPILYPTPVACDDHVHKSKNNPRLSSLSDYYGLSPSTEVFKKVMGFPYDYLFVGKRKDQIRQIGNAVCPPIAKAIAEAILEAT